MGSSDDTSVPSFMRNPGWEKLQKEIQVGQAAKRAEAVARLDELKAALEAATEFEPGASALGTTATDEELFVLHRRFHRFTKISWLVEKSLATGERDEIIELWTRVGDAEPRLEAESFISFAKAKEAEAKRQEGQMETIRQLMQASKVGIGVGMDLPETSSLGGTLDNEETTYVLSRVFFEENPGFRSYFYAMLFSEPEKRQLVWLFDEISPKSFVSVADLKRGMAKARDRRLQHGTGSEPISTIGDRIDPATFQGDLDRHSAVTGKPKARTTKVKPEESGEKKEKAPREPRPRRKKAEPTGDADDDSHEGTNSASPQPRAKIVEHGGNGSEAHSSVADRLGSDAVEALEAVAS